MSETDPRVLAAPRAQLAARPTLLDSGERHVGWKALRAGASA